VAENLSELGYETEEWPTPPPPTTTSPRPKTPVVKRDAQFAQCASIGQHPKPRLTVALGWHSFSPDEDGDCLYAIGAWVTPSPSPSSPAFIDSLKRLRKDFAAVHATAENLDLLQAIADGTPDDEHSDYLRNLPPRPEAWYPEDLEDPGSRPPQFGSYDRLKDIWLGSRDDPDARLAAFRKFMERTGVEHGVDKCYYACSRFAPFLANRIDANIVLIHSRLQRDGNYVEVVGRPDHNNDAVQSPLKKFVLLKFVDCKLHYELLCRPDPTRISHLKGLRGNAAKMEHLKGEGSPQFMFELSELPMEIRSAIELSPQFRPNEIFLKHADVPGVYFMPDVDSLRLLAIEVAGVVKRYFVAHPAAGPITYSRMDGEQHRCTTANSTSFNVLLHFIRRAEEIYKGGLNGFDQRKDWPFGDVRFEITRPTTDWRRPSPVALPCLTDHGTLEITLSTDALPRVVHYNKHAERGFEMSHPLARRNAALLRPFDELNSDSHRRHSFEHVEFHDGDSVRTPRPTQPGEMTLLEPNVLSSTPDGFRIVAVITLAKSGTSGGSVSSPLSATKDRTCPLWLVKNIIRSYPAHDLKRSLPYLSQIQTAREQQLFDTFRSFASGALVRRRALFEWMVSSVVVLFALELLLCSHATSRVLRASSWGPRPRCAAALFWLGLRKARRRRRTARRPRRRMRRIRRRRPARPPPPVPAAPAPAPASAAASASAAPARVRVRKWCRGSTMMRRYTCESASRSTWSRRRQRCPM
jgi:hypothetical protein